MMDSLDSGLASPMLGIREGPRFAVWGGRMNLSKQVEPL